ncbi:lytic transglycosylase domain-containing protein [Acidocella sp. KAb 2-4]|uniref:lytic transglycosylase domain-containing protein n=1 Tax=Acidocella sp. KAb 2-4 TaxID=2885158 RepID=UPI001D07F103|nr:lytic transglycosylase domain-containing protein [Acidocella sp. KAb 2-4]MCB5943329.1 lytic transglycosylase domain-containing protein [Acidocella sp. KAb 2-4]
MNGESVAYAIPRNAPSGEVEVTLPQPLAPSDVALYKRILQLQDSGAYAEADKLIARLDDNSLVGSVLAARYLSPDYVTSPAELTAWWAKYADEPEAAEIYQLMQHKLSRASLPPAPQTALLPETTITAGAAAMPVYAPDSALWHARFMTGLEAWERGDLVSAGKIFAATAQLPGISDDDRAASQFWAARAALRQQQPEQYLDWLHQAAWASSTFYGMLAGKLLGQGFGPTGISATLTEADVIAVDSLPEGHRAFALLQIGEPAQAAQALRALWPQMQANPALSRSVMAVAARAGLADVTIAIASTMPSPVDEIAGARLPLPALHPTGGFTVDPSLVYALTRTESGFDPRAVSRCGARGLMQLMPTTAAAVRRTEGVDGSLSDPSANLAMGQAYLRYLGEQPGVNNNLLAVLAGYNAGPNAAASWYSQLQDTSDPLLFIETIPNNETRRFVRQVLADSWLYAEEIGAKPASLDALAEGNYPQLNLNVYTADAN